MRGGGNEEVANSGEDRDVGILGAIVQTFVRAMLDIRHDGFVTLPCRGREVSVHQELSGRTDCLAPRAHRRGAKRAMGEMAPRSGTVFGGG